MTTDTSTASKGLSVVIAIHDMAVETEQNLPRFLEMESEAAYEVIVVDDSSTDETPDVLRRMKTAYPKLYTTFLPKSVVFNPSRLQLALTIGAKAAYYPTIVLADIQRPPMSAEWLKALSSNASEVTMVYGGKKEDSPVRVQAWDGLDEAEPLIQKAERRSGKGHNGRWMKLRRGHYDAVAVSRERIHDAIRLFDRRITAGSLWGLRLRVFWKNLTNKPQTL